LEKEINKSIIFKLSRVEYSFFDKAELYNKVEYAMREVRNIGVVVENFTTIISSILSICIIFPYLFKIDLKLMLIVFVMNLPIAFLQLKLKKLNLITSKESVYYRRCANGIKNMLINKYYAGEVRVFSLVKWLYHRFQKYMCCALKVENGRNKSMHIYDIFVQAIVAVMTMIVQITLIKYVIYDVITIGSFTLYNTYINKFGTCILDIVNNISALYEKDIFLNNLFSFLNDNKYEYSMTGSEKIKSGLHKIEFKNVTFKYANSKQNILDNISFIVNEGEVLAIVGLNGAGKTTIFNLLLRFYKPLSGTILLDGKDINSYDIGEYYKEISVVFQSPKLYPWSLKENVMFENLDIEMTIPDWFEDLIKKYPEGLQTIILPYFDSKGIEPSHGETQRIALARAMNKEAGILLLDEPSASMDVEIDYKIFSDLKNICKNKTSIIISHRLSSVTTADQIIYLKDAKIIEQGNHSQLMTKEGEYSKMFLMQAEKYIN